MDATEVTESLDQAWGKIEEGIALVRFASYLIENDKEKDRWEKVLLELTRLERRILRIVFLWDQSPSGEQIRRRSLQASTPSE
jgi:hypothetical protein